MSPYLILRSLSSDPVITNQPVSCIFLLLSYFRYFLPPWESQNVCVHCQKCSMFMIFKTLGHLASQTKFCSTQK